MSCNRALFLFSGHLGWESSRDFCTQWIGIDSQFPMRLSYALSHSPDSDADSLGLNLCQSFLRHSLAVILNLCMNLVGLASNTDYCSLASRMAMNVGQAFLHETKYGEFYFRGQPFQVSGIFSSILSPLRSARPSMYQRSADDSPLSSSIGGCKRYDVVRISWVRF